MSEIHRRPTRPPIPKPPKGGFLSPHERAERKEKIQRIQQQDQEETIGEFKKRSVQQGTGTTPLAKESSFLFDIKNFFVNLFDRIAQTFVTSTEKVETEARAASSNVGISPALNSLTQTELNAKNVISELLGKSIQDLNLDSLDATQLQRIEKNIVKFMSEGFYEAVVRSAKELSPNSPVKTAAEELPDLLNETLKKAQTLLGEKIEGYIKTEVTPSAEQNQAVFNHLRLSSNWLIPPKKLDKDHHYAILQEMKDGLNKENTLINKDNPSGLVCNMFWDDLHRCEMYEITEKGEKKLINPGRDDLDYATSQATIKWKKDIIQNLRKKLGYKENATQEEKDKIEAKLFKFSQIFNQSSFATHETRSLSAQNPSQQLSNGEGFVPGQPAGSNQKKNTFTFCINDDGSIRTIYSTEAAKLSRINFVDQISLEAASKELDPDKSYYKSEYSITLDNDGELKITDNDFGRIAFNIVEKPKNS